MLVVGITAFNSTQFFLMMGMGSTARETSPGADRRDPVVLPQAPALESPGRLRYLCRRESTGWIIAVLIRMIACRHHRHDQRGDAGVPAPFTLRIPVSFSAAFCGIRRQTQQNKRVLSHFFLRRVLQREDLPPFGGAPAGTCEGNKRVRRNKKVGGFISFCQDPQ